MRFQKSLIPLCMVAGIAGCAFIIPPEQNSPRHNTVLGAPHKPALNNAVGPQSSLRRPEGQGVASQPAPQGVASAEGSPYYGAGAAKVREEARSTVLGVPVPSLSRHLPSWLGGMSEEEMAQQSNVNQQGVAANLPPVDEQVQARAAQEMQGANGALAPLPPVTPEEAAAAAPAAGGAEMAMAPRRVPIENRAYHVASNDYPALQSVPPRPVMSGEGSSKADLTAVQSTLEKDRSAAMESKQTLARDAAAEPSMLSELPKTDGVVPPNDPINAVPMALPQPVMPAGNPPVQEITPAPVAKPAAAIESKPMAEAMPLPVRVESIPAPVVASAAVVPAAQPVVVASVPPALPTAPHFAPPAPLGAMPKVEAASVAPLPTVPAQAIEVATLAPAAPVAASQPNVRAGDFDPLAIVDNAPVAKTATRSSYVPLPTTVANRFIAPSRYVEYR